MPFVPTDFSAKRATNEATYSPTITTTFGSTHGATVPASHRPAIASTYHATNDTALKTAIVAANR